MAFLEALCHYFPASGMGGGAGVREPRRTLGSLAAGQYSNIGLRESTSTMVVAKPSELQCF